MRKIVEFIATLLAVWFAANLLGIALGHVVLGWCRSGC